MTNDYIHELLIIIANQFPQEGIDLQNVLHFVFDDSYLLFVSVCELHVRWDLSEVCFEILHVYFATWYLIKFLNELS